MLAAGARRRFTFLPLAEPQAPRISFAASSRVSSFAAACRPGLILEIDVGERLSAFVFQAPARSRLPEIGIVGGELSKPHEPAESGMRLNLGNL